MWFHAFCTDRNGKGHRGTECRGVLSAGGRLWARSAWVVRHDLTNQRVISWFVTSTCRGGLLQGRSSFVGDKNAASLAADFMMRHAVLIVAFIIVFLVRGKGSVTAQHRGRCVGLDVVRGFFVWLRKCAHLIAEVSRIVMR